MTSRRGWRGLIEGMRRAGLWRKALSQARTARRKGRFDLAARYYRAALNLMGSRTDVRIQLANMLKDSGQFEEAEAAYFQALSEDPRSADIHLQIGHLHKLAGRRAAAAASYERAVELDPLLAPARRELADFGERTQQIALYEAQMREGGVDVLLAIKARLDDIARQVDAMRARLPDAHSLVSFPIETYTEMRRLFDVPSPGVCGGTLTIRIVLLADREPLGRLYDQLSAVLRQTYPHWSLSVLGAEADRREVVERAGAQDGRIRWVEAAADQNLVRSELEIGAAPGADWSLLLAEGAQLHRQALAWIASAAERTRCLAIFADEETGPNDDLRPTLRHLADPDSLLEANLCGGTIAVGAATLASAAICAEAATLGESRSRLWLELVGRGGVAHIPLPLTYRPVAQASHMDDHRNAVQARLGDRLVIEASTWPDEVLRIVRPAPEPRPRLAVVIPSKNNSYDLSVFVGSLIDLASRPGALEILVLNNGDPNANDPILNALAQRPTVTVRNLAEPFNWSRFSNIGARWTDAPILVFANDDMLMLTRGWDDLIRAELQRPEVGALGARLLYRDDTIQHAGVLFDWKGSVIHDGLYSPSQDGGPNHRWHVTRAVSAVTGAFLCTRRTDFDSVDGFDEVELPVAYSDIDYALKLRAKNLRIIWTPHLSLYHYESKTRGLDHLTLGKRVRSQAERRNIEARWPGVFEVEPSLNAFWRQAALPFRLLSPPSTEAVWAYIERSAQADPWALGPDTGARHPIR